MTDNNLRKRLLSTEDLTSDTVTVATQHECVERDSYILTNRLQSYLHVGSDVNVLSRKGNNRKVKVTDDKPKSQITNCLFYARSDESGACPAYKKRCLNCGKQGT